MHTAMISKQKLTPKRGDTVRAIDRESGMVGDAYTFLSADAEYVYLMAPFAFYRTAMHLDSFRRLYGVARWVKVKGGTRERATWYPLSESF